MQQQVIHLTKHQGLGNDFLVLLESQNPTIVVDASDAIRWCDRHRGIGADGLIWVRTAHQDDIDADMVLFNSDGSLAEISGNGIRCLGQALLRSRGHRDGTLQIHTAAGVRELVSVPTSRPNEDQLSVSMGEIEPIEVDIDAVRSAAAPVSVDKIGAASVGNPHIVIATKSIDAIDLDKIGPAVESIFRDGMNVHLIEASGPSTLLARHWERGAGITLACGSGATVAATLASAWGLVSGPVKVSMPGGVAVVDVETGILTGPSEFIANCEVWR